MRFSKRSGLRQRVRLLIVTTCAVGAGSCRPGPPRQAVVFPHGPDERLTGHVVYSPAPVVIVFDQFQQALNMRDDQVSLIYLIGPDGDYREQDLRCLDDVHRRFYRYGVQVLLVDLHNADKRRWRRLTQRLAAVDASFPAAMLDRADLDRLGTFLKLRDWPTRQAFLIDPSAELIRPMAVESDAALRDELRQFLQKRSKHSHVSDRTP